MIHAAQILLTCKRKTFAIGFNDRAETTSCKGEAFDRMH